MTRSPSWIFAALALACYGCAPALATATSSGTAARTAMFARDARIEGRTEVTTPVFARSNSIDPLRMEFSLYAAHPDTVLSAPLGSVIFFFAHSVTPESGWRFEWDNDLNLLLDGSDRLWYRGVHYAAFRRRREAVGFTVPVADLRRIGAASSIEGRVGSWSFSLRPEEIAKLREMAQFASMDPNAPRPRRRRERS
ncbi:MAG TPA: hypothetical protein VF615_08190 [Longimicrobiaceae bacterium]